MENRKMKKWLKNKTPKWLETFCSYMGLDDLAAVVFLLMGILGYFDRIIPVALENVYNDIRSELISIGVTVFIIGNVDQHIRTQMEKRRLILQMGSPDKAFAIEAVRQLRERGWLYDGTTKGAYLSMSNLSGAHLNRADLSGVNFLGTDLSEADLLDTDLSGAGLLGADLSGARLLGADLSGAGLRGAYLSGANLLNADLSEASLLGTDLSETNLLYANLSGANLSEANLEGAIYNKNTNWPDGFDPRGAGAVRDDEE